MDSLQDQITVLSVKVDALHQTIERLGSQIAVALSEVKSTTAEKTLSQPGSYAGRSLSQVRTFDKEMEHKDVLSDFNYAESELQSGERSLSSEVQIQRLTAQLTAAYNRIAALEEQLLSMRIH